jgi:hypothetical protein
MPEPSRGSGRKVPTFHAVQSRQVFYRYMAMAVAIVACGVLVILVALFLLINTPPRVFHVFMLAFSFAVVIIGVDIGRHNWPKGSRQSVVVDLRSVRLLEDGAVQKEFRFGDAVRLGGSFNTAFHVPDFKPLAGVEFEQRGDVIEVSPRESYELEDVERLWPLALVLAKTHRMVPTPDFEKLMEREAKRSLFWHEARHELTGKKTKVMSRKGPKKAVVGQGPK